MKMTKKKVFVASLAVCLVAVLSMGTLAWFTATDSVENIFQVSTETGATDADFELTLFESQLLADGTLGTTEVDGNTYTNVAPGDALAKDPTVRNDGAYGMWVRAKVTLTGYADWQAVLGTGYDFRNILGGVSADWSYATTETDATAGTLTLIYYKDAKLDVNEESTLFTSINVPTEFTVENIPTQFNVNVVAEAIQSDNTGNSAQAAFASYWN